MHLESRHTMHCEQLDRFLVQDKEMVAVVFEVVSALAGTPSTWGYSAHLREVLQRALTAVRTPYAFPADTLAPLNFHGA